MTNVIEQIPERWRGIVVEVLDERDRSLLAALRRQERPTAEQRDTAADILMDEFTRELGPGHEPSARGKLIDDAVGQFFLLWPADELR
jgi:hypothetical protein